MGNQSTSLSEARPASRIRPAGNAAGSPTRGEASPSSLRDWLAGQASAGWCSRTSSGFSRRTEDATLPLFSRSSPDGTSKSPTADGELRESSPTRQGTSAFRGECWTLDIPEFPHFRGRCRSEGVVSSLSDVVVAGEAPQRCCLAANYAEAMLARAARLGYSLPPALERVLRRSASPST